MRIDARLIPVALCAALFPATGKTEAPLSAIDWLSESIASPVVMPSPSMPEEPAVSGGALPEEISTQPLNGLSRDSAGLLSPAVTGLPRDLWGSTPATEIAARIASEQPATLPALQDFIYTLLLAELDPPTEGGDSGQIFFARIDKLLDYGALDPAMSLLEQVGQEDGEIFRRFFDVALLTGEEDRACEKMGLTPEIAPTFQARIFCLARNGDWNAAALSLRTGTALGYISEEEDHLLSRFLDPELFEGEPPLSPPSRPTPLVWRMFEAIGEPIPTATLPVAFAHADLRANTGWKGQLEAAERLARLGAISPNRLFAFYTERVAAASGGVWDRVRAIQRLETALADEDAEAVGAILPVVWTAMSDADLEVVLAHLYGERLMGLPLDDVSGALAFRIALLSAAYEEAAQAREAANDTERLLIEVARGNIRGNGTRRGMAGAVQEGLTATEAPESFVSLVADDRMGEALLAAIGKLNDAAEGDMRGATEGLASLRHVGLEDVARRVALQLLILDRQS